MDVYQPRLPGAFIGNGWVEPLDGGFEDVLNPATEAVYGVAAVGGVKDCDRALAAARAAYESGPWRRISRRDAVTALPFMVNPGWAGDKVLGSGVKQRVPVGVVAGITAFNAGICWTARQAAGRRHFGQRFLNLAGRVWRLLKRMAAWAWGRSRSAGWPKRLGGRRPLCRCCRPSIWQRRRSPALVMRGRRQNFCRQLPMGR